MGPALAVDDHADPAKDAAQRHEQADGSDGYEAHVVNAASRRDRLRQRGSYDVSKENRREKRYEDLAWRVRAQRDSPPDQGSERGQG